jgi:hypothetical protein
MNGEPEQLHRARPIATVVSGVKIPDLTGGPVFTAKNDSANSTTAQTNRASGRNAPNMTAPNKLTGNMHGD